MKLSHFFDVKSVARDTDFNHLGYVDTVSDRVLAYADTVKYLNIALANPNITALITTSQMSERARFVPGLVIADNPRQLFYMIHQKFVEGALYKRPFKAGIGSGCNIHPSAVISPHCRIGDNVKIGEHVIIRDAVWIDSNVTIEAGVKLGVDGILYDKNPSGGVKLIPHGGYVHIQEGAILMTNAIVVRSIHDTDFTLVGKGALVGLGAIVGHEAKVCDAAIVSNLCVVARRSVIGKNAFLGTNVTVKENVKIGCNAKVMAGSVVVDDVLDNETVSGNFATEHKLRMLSYARSKMRVKGR